MSTAVVDVLRFCNAHKLTEGNVTTKGNVQHVIDNNIGKLVWRVAGSVPAANYFRVPKTKQDSLRLLGGYLYIQIRGHATHFFAVHVDAVDTYNNTHRITISNLLRSKSSQDVHSLQVPLMDLGTKWTILALDLPALMALTTHAPFMHVASVQLCANCSFRSVFCCSEKYASQDDFPREMRLPAVVGGRQAQVRWLPDGPLQQGTPCSTIPKLPSKGKGATGSQPKENQGPATSREPVLANSRTDGQCSANAPKLQAGSARSPSPHGHCKAASSGMQTACTQGGWQPHDAPTACGNDDIACSQSVHKHAHPTGEGHDATTGLLQKLPPAEALLRFPAAALLHIQHVVHVDVGTPHPCRWWTGQLNRLLLAAGQHLLGQSSTQHSGSSRGRAVTAAATTPADAGPAQLLFGPVNGAIRGFDVDSRGRTVLLVVEGAAGGLQGLGPGDLGWLCLWDLQSNRLLAKFSEHAGPASAAALSRDGNMVVAVGPDATAKQRIVQWHVTRGADPVHVTMAGRSNCPRPAVRLSISPYGDQRSVTLGQGHIRVWRCKGEQLRGVSIRLDEVETVGPSPDNPPFPLLNDTFTDVAFATELFGSANTGRYHRVYVASATGCVVQLDWEKQLVQCVYQLHDAPINCLVFAPVAFYASDTIGRVARTAALAGPAAVPCAHDGKSSGLGRNLTSTVALDMEQTKSSDCGQASPVPCLVTGGEDGHVRVWGMDMETCYMEVSHGAPVLSVDVDALSKQLCTVTAEGAVGTVDCPTHQYRPLLNTHTSPVQHVALHPDGKCYATCSASGVRLLRLPHHQQVMEFTSSGGDLPACCAWHPGMGPGQQLTLVVGYGSGVLRCFDASQGKLLSSQRQHHLGVSHVAFTGDGSVAVTTGHDGLIALHNARVPALPLIRLVSLPKAPAQGPSAPCLAVHPSAAVAVLSHSSASSTSELLLLPLVPVQHSMHSLQGRHIQLGNSQHAPRDAEALGFDAQERLWVVCKTGQVLCYQCKQLRNETAQQDQQWELQPLLVHGKTRSLARCLCVAAQSGTQVHCLAVAWEDGCIGLLPVYSKGNELYMGTTSILHEAIPCDGSGASWLCWIAPGQLLAAAGTAVLHLRVQPEELQRAVAAVRAKVDLEDATTQLFNMEHQPCAALCSGQGQPPSPAEVKNAQCMTHQHEHPSRQCSPGPPPHRTQRSKVAGSHALACPQIAQRAGRMVENGPPAAAMVQHRHQLSPATKAQDGCRHPGCQHVDEASCSLAVAVHEKGMQTADDKAAQVELEGGACAETSAGARRLPVPALHQLIGLDSFPGPCNAMRRTGATREGSPGRARSTSPGPTRGAAPGGAGRKLGTVQSHPRVRDHKALAADVAGTMIRRSSLNKDRQHGWAACRAGAPGATTAELPTCALAVSGRVAWDAARGIVVYPGGGRVVVEDIATGEQRFVASQAAKVGPVALSADGTTLAVAQHSLSVKDNGRGKQLQRRPVSPVPPVSTASSWAVCLYDMEDGGLACRATLRLTGAAQPQGLSFSRDGALLLGIAAEEWGDDMALLLWAATDGVLVSQAPLPTALTSISWVPQHHTTGTEVAKEASSRACTSSEGGCLVSETPGVQGATRAQEYQFITLDGSQQVLLWTLQPDALTCQQLFIDAPPVEAGHQGAAGAGFTALAAVDARTVLLSDAAGAVWEYKCAHHLSSLSGPASATKIVQVDSGEPIIALKATKGRIIAATGSSWASWRRPGVGRPGWLSCQSGVLVAAGLAGLAADGAAQELVVADAAGNLWYADAGSGWTVPIVQGVTSPILWLKALYQEGPAVARSAEGSTLVALGGTADGELVVWHAEDVEDAENIGGGGRVGKFKRFWGTAKAPCLAGACCWSVGTAVAGYSSGALQAWDLWGPGGPAWTAHAGDAPVVAMEVLPHGSGNILLSADRTGTLVSWNSANGQRLQTACPRSHDPMYPLQQLLVAASAAVSAVSRSCSSPKRQCETTQQSRKQLSAVAPTGLLQYCLVYPDSVYVVESNGEGLMMRTLGSCTPPAAAAAEQAQEQSFAHAALLHLPNSSAAAQSGALLTSAASNAVAVLFGSMPTDVYVYHLSAGTRLVRVLQPRWGPLGALSAAGQLVLLAGRDGGALLVDAVTKQQAILPGFHGQCATCMAMVDGAAADAVSGGGGEPVLLAALGSTLMVWKTQNM